MMKVEYLAEFKGSPTLRIAGTPNELTSLFERFTELANGRQTSHRLPDDGGVKVVAQAAKETRGLRAQSAGDTTRFDWTLTREIWATHAAKLRELIESRRPGHQYLESRGDEAVVLISQNETA